MTALVERPGTEGRLQIFCGSRLVGWTLPPISSTGLWETYWRDGSGHMQHSPATSADRAAEQLRTALKEI